MKSFPSLSHIIYCKCEPGFGDDVLYVLWIYLGVEKFVWKAEKKAVAELHQVYINLGIWQFMWDLYHEVVCL